MYRAFFCVIYGFLLYCCLESSGVALLREGGGDMGAIYWRAFLWPRSTRWVLGLRVNVLRFVGDSLSGFLRCLRLTRYEREGLGVSGRRL